MNLSEWLGVAGLALGVGGFLLTILAVLDTRRIAKAAKTAAEAARDAATTTRAEMVRNLLLALGPDLERIEDALDRAVLDNDTVRVRERVVEWRRRATEVRGLLGEHSDDNRHIEELLQQSAAVATTTKEALDGKGALKTITKQLRNDISTVNSYIQAFTSRLRASTGDQS